KDWTGAAFPRKRQIAFDAARVKFAIQRTDEKNCVDVRCDDLLFGFLARDFAGELAPAREYEFDLRAFSILSYQNPVPDCGQHFTRNRFVAQSSTQLSPDFAAF